MLLMNYYMQLTNLKEIVDLVSKNHDRVRPLLVLVSY